jgi:uncharacterized membrane protein
MEVLAQFHPKVIHFAIAFLLGYVLLELLGAFLKKDFLSKSAHLLLFLGVLGALAAVITGNQAFNVWEYWNKESSALMESHETYATITIFYFFAVLVLRTFFVFKKKFSGFIPYAFVVLAVIGTYFVYQTGEMGGAMVYKHGIGTEYKIKIMEE